MIASLGSSSQLMKVGPTLLRNSVTLIKAAWRFAMRCVQFTLKAFVAFIAITLLVIGLAYQCNINLFVWAEEQYNSMPEIWQPTRLTITAQVVGANGETTITHYKYTYDYLSDCEFDAGSELLAPNPEYKIIDFSCEDEN